MRTPVLLGLVAALAAEDLVELRAVPLRLRLTDERLELPDDEVMGLAGLHLDLLNATPIPGIYAGLGGYGAAGGNRGGLFVLGASLGWRSPAWHGLRLDANGFAGGGGGASAGQGDGLMVRGHVMTTLTLGAWELGGGVARSEFPNGEIDDTGVTFGISRFITGTAASAWQGEAASAGALTTESWSLAPHYLAYFPGDDDRSRSGAPLAHRVDLIGISLSYHLNQQWWLPLQAAAAVNGGAAGYMEVLGGIAWRPVIVGGLHLDSRFLAGLGGGGSIDTGGGVMIRPELGMGLDLGSAFTLAARGGWVKAVDGDFDGAALTGELCWNSDYLALTDGTSRVTLPASTVTLERWRIMVSNAVYDLRSSTADNMQLVGVAIERPLSPYFSLVGRARSAWKGDAGGYSEGLFGARLGISWWRLGLAAQAQVGAGGGGGVPTGDGIIGDLQVTGRLRLTESFALHVGGGRVEAHDGGFSADVLEAGLVWSCAAAK